MKMMPVKERQKRPWNPLSSPQFGRYIDELGPVQIPESWRTWRIGSASTRGSARKTRYVGPKRCQWDPRRREELCQWNCAMLLTAASITANEMVWLSAFAAPVAAMPMALDNNRGQHQLPTSAGIENNRVPILPITLVQLSVGPSSTASTCPVVFTRAALWGLCHALAVSAPGPQ